MVAGRRESVCTAHFYTVTSADVKTRLVCKRPAPEHLAWSCRPDFPPQPPTHSQLTRWCAWTLQMLQPSPP